MHGPGLAASQLGAGLGGPAGLGQSYGQVGKRRLFSVVRPDQGGARRGSVACAVPLLEVLTAPGTSAARAQKTPQGEGMGSGGERRRDPNVEPSTVVAEKFARKKALWPEVPSVFVLEWGSKAQTETLSVFQD